MYFPQGGIEIFAFLELRRNWTFFRGLLLWVLVFFARKRFDAVLTVVRMEFAIYTKLKMATIKLKIS
jgi:hypothetical protein